MSWLDYSELNDLWQNEDTVTDIKLRRLEWLGHFIWTESNRISKTVLRAKVEGKGSVERPKLRWLNDVQLDLKTRGIKGKPKTDQNGWTSLGRLRSNCEERNAIEEEEEEEEEEE